MMGIGKLLCLLYCVSAISHSSASPVLAHISTTIGAASSIPSDDATSLRVVPHTQPATSTISDKLSKNATVQECDFDSIEKFFEYAYEQNLNITAEVQNCQNLCIMTYGNGNPDLSGIGMMHAYNLQVVLTFSFGPAYRLLQMIVLHYGVAPEGTTFHLFMSELQNIQSLFYSSNGFFIISSAVASLVRLAQNTTIFEVAEMQALAFLQLNSLLVSFFCLARPIRRWVAKTFVTTVVFVFVTVVLAKTQLSSRKRKNWKQAAIGCENSVSDFGVITPIPYPPSAVAVFAVAGFLGLCLRSLRAKFQGSKRNRVLFKMLMAIWVMLIVLMTSCMILGLIMVWRQREHLRKVVGSVFEDDIWGFGQVAALFIWAPLPVDMMYLLSNAAQQTFPLWNRLMNKEVADFIPWKSRNGSSTVSSVAKSTEEVQTEVHPPTSQYSGNV